jgi:glycosyltransferase involved in cell wall biosynthesis
VTPPVQKRILFITAFPPNDKSGGQVFSKYLLNDLMQKYSIDLIYFQYKNHDIDINTNINVMNVFGGSIFNSLNKINAYPLFTKRFDKKILNYINVIKDCYDILFFDYIQVGLYALYLDHPYKVIRCHDVLGQKYMRKKSIFCPWIKKTESAILRNVHKIFVPSAKDVGLIKNYYNVSSYATNEYIKKFDFEPKEENLNTFILYGLWSRMENLEGLVWFIKYILPQVKRNNVNINFVVIGGGMPGGIIKKYFGGEECLDYLGYVENPLELIYSSRALIAPLFNGAGVKVKVIESFTTGTPVIGTDVAFEGLPEIQELVYRAETAGEFVKNIMAIPFSSHEEKKCCAEKFMEVYNKNHLSEYL